MTEAELRTLWADDAACDLDPIVPPAPTTQLGVQAMLERHKIRNRLVDVHADMDRWESEFLHTLGKIVDKP